MCTKFNRYAKTGFKRERERERDKKNFVLKWSQMRKKELSLQRRLEVK